MLGVDIAKTSSRLECMNQAALTTIDDAAHFMIATHAGEVGRLIGEHVDDV